MVSGDCLSAIVSREGRAKKYGPHRMLYNRFIRWSRLGAFDRIFAARAGERPERIMIYAHLKAHRTAASLLKNGISPWHRAHKGGLNSKLDAARDGVARKMITRL